MKAIAVVDKIWGIGRSNGLLFQLKKDMRRFREKTLGKVVAMGSNTLKSFPGGKPLFGRKNVVLYPGGEKRTDCEVAGDFSELRAILEKYDSDDVFIIGGAMFYRTMLPYCDTAFITKVDADGGAEVFFENLDKNPDWELTDVGEPFEDGGYGVRFTVYENRAAKNFFGGISE